MSTNLRDGDVIAWPTTNRTTLRQRLADWIHRDQKPGRHRPGQVTPVGPDHLLTPAARQLATRTRDQVHADVDQDTGLLAPRDVTLTGAWTRPTGVATDGEIQQWVTDGAVIDDQTTGQVTA
ncbi:hypothetical protein ACPB67_02490 [Micromonospora taraxaci]|uniref:hypothetical protein n=1 Tax=Micromonospora taraxaci TaxID=1316803 RepID=UPI003C2B5058